MINLPIMNKILILGLLFLVSKHCHSQNENDSLPSKKYSAPLAEEKFWQIIESSKTKSNSKEQQYDAILNSLKSLSLEETAGFRIQTDKLLNISYKNELWCAAYIINSGCSDDGFEYFRCWLISKGKKVFYETLKNPDYLVNHTTSDDDENEFEDFWNVANDAFQKKTGRDLHAFLERSSIDAYKPIKLTWNEDDPNSMKKICPKLFKKFWEE